MLNSINRIPILVRSPLRFGFIGGVLGFALVVVLYFIGTHPFLIPVFLDFRIVLIVVLLIFCLKELRDFYFKGVLYFWQGMIASFILTVILAITASGLILLFATQVPQFVSSYVDQFLTQAKAFPPEVIERIGTEAFERNLATLPTTTAFDLALLYFGQCFVISFFVSIIISVILRRQPQTQ